MGDLREKINNNNNHVLISMTRIKRFVRDCLENQKIRLAEFSSEGTIEIVLGTTRGPWQVEYFLQKLACQGKKKNEKENQTCPYEVMKHNVEIWLWIIFTIIKHPEKGMGRNNVN